MTSSLNHTTGLALRLAGSLRQAILAGAYEPDDKLPTEQQISQTQGVSRATVRDALRMLQAEGLIDRRQGSGSYVRPRSSRNIPLLRGGYSRSIEPYKHEMSRQVDAWRWTEADAGLAHAMDVFEGESVLWARRFDLLQGQVVASDELWIHGPAATRMTRPDLEQLDFLERWQAVQDIAISHVRQRIQAGAASALMARALNLRRGAPVLVEDDLVFLEGEDTAAGRFVTHYRSDVYLLESTVLYRQT